jgi:hypothetical protein
MADGGGAAPNLAPAPGADPAIRCFPPDASAEVRRKYYSESLKSFLQGVSTNAIASATGREYVLTASGLMLLSDAVRAQVGYHSSPRYTTDQTLREIITSAMHNIFEVLNPILESAADLDAWVNQVGVKASRGHIFADEFVNIESDAFKRLLDVERATFNAKTQDKRRERLQHLRAQLAKLIDQRDAISSKIASVSSLLVAHNKLMKEAMKSRSERDNKRAAKARLRLFQEQVERQVKTMRLMIDSGQAGMYVCQSSCPFL